MPKAIQTLGQNVNFLFYKELVFTDQVESCRYAPIKCKQGSGAQKKRNHLRPKAYWLKPCPVVN
ncbi:hypothetical protein GCM10007107_34660 [Shewanella indica]|nr:hypothetical protein GCM10007107_34660 [Shewanella indica]